MLQISYSLFLSASEGEREFRSMFNVLVGAVDVRKELHDIERRMDKDHFTDLLSGGYFNYEGVDKKSMHPLCWTRSGGAKCWTRSGLMEGDAKSCEAGKFSYVAGSPKALALLR